MYDDFVQLYARSGTMYVPTLVVAAPGTYQGELYWYQTTDVHADEKLHHFLPHEAVDHKSRTSQRFALDEYYSAPSRSARSPTDAISPGTSRGQPSRQPPAARASRSVREVEIDRTCSAFPQVEVQCRT